MFSAAPTEKPKDKPGPRQPKLDRGIGSLPWLATLTGAVTPYVAGIAARAVLQSRGATVVPLREGFFALVEVSIYLAIAFFVMAFYGKIWSRAATDDRTFRNRVFFSSGAIIGATLMSLWFCYSTLSQDYGIEALLTTLVLNQPLVILGLLLSSLAGAVLGRLIAEMND